MIKLTFDRFDFLSAVEGFARGSHLRQHVWKEVVFKNIYQMSDDEQDFFWYIMRRDLWECYFGFTKHMNGTSKQCGWDDYLHALAALHRGNRYVVTFLGASDRKRHKALCYKYNEKYRPLSVGRLCRKNQQSFYSYIDEKDILLVVKLGKVENRYVPDTHQNWWADDLALYDHPENIG